MGHHLLLVPCPLQGHMNPMLHMAKLLQTRGGFVITIVMLTPEAELIIDTCNYPEFFFHSIHGSSPELSSATSSGDDVLRYLNQLNESCEKPFRGYLQSKLASGCSPPTKLVVIYDAVMYFSAAVADEFGIPRIVLRTSSASTFLALSLDLSQKDVVAKEFPILRDKDKPVFASNNGDISNKVLSRIHHGTRTASAVIWNSLHCLEGAIFKKLKDKISSPIFPICPSLHHRQQKDSSSFFFETSQPEDQSCISWLDTRASNSVLYVSTGSLVRVSKSELSEMAWGLANSGQSFLWVVRPGLVDDPTSEFEVLPKGFAEATRKRGKVVRWAPQKKVLGHRSIGGFWTHNGWNSTVESVSEGVPMICWPRVGDQRVNARVVSHVWRVGMELEERFGRREVERAIRRIMADEEGREIRKRAVELKEKVRLSLEQGGSSFEHLGKLVNHLLGYNLS